MAIPHADFLTPAEFHRGPDLLRPGTLTGKNVDPAAVAFIYTLFPYAGVESDIQVMPEDRHVISWPAPMGHERVADREPVLQAMFGPDYEDATKVAAYEQEIYDGGFAVIGKKLGYDSVELRRLAVARNLFGRFGRVRGVPCLMLWNECENWEAMLDNVLVLLDVPDDGLTTQGIFEQWWVSERRGQDR
jgi:hypothetical protein